MTSIIKAPSRYIQGKGEIKNLAKHLGKLGSKYLILLSERTYERVGDDIKASFNESETVIVFEYFNGECSLSEIERVMEIAKGNVSDGIIAVGGGKTIDTAKAVAQKLDLPVVIIPTIASNDAPCSGLSVVYNDQGVVVKVIYSKRNPDLVLVDSEIISKAPVSLLVAGMGDALATYFEARAVKASGARNMARGNVTNTAMIMSRLCYDLLIANGVEAKKAAENKEVNEALESVLEANILLSGIGFESGGLAAAHAINDGFTFVTQAHDKLHGEKVAFGTLVQLVLENGCKDELNEVLDFLISVGLPVTLADLGITNVIEAEIRDVAKAACVKTQSTKNMPFLVSEEDVYNAIMKADEIGRARKEK
ncbi:glycerol dehydrogenase [Clostridium sp.]|uniref:glycerol dehydrogenase n=1 Tax=Clostridium sp. TaxID=1506 RepID=UPI0032162B1D